jgi:hypothetical protein
VGLWSRAVGVGQTLKHFQNPTLQSKILRKITNVRFYVSNQTIHSDLKVPYVLDHAIEKYKCFHGKLPSHPNPLAQNLQSLHIPGNPIRRLNRRRPRDFLM